MLDMPAAPVRILVAYSPADRFAAETVSRALGDAGMPCDSYSGAPGDRAALATAVGNVQALVILHSRTAAADEHVLRLAEAAAGRRLPMLVVRMDATAPSPGLTAFLRTVPWVDAANGKLPDRLGGIIVRVKQLCGVPLGDADAEAVDDREGGIDLWSIERRRVPRIWIVIGLVLLAGLAVLAYRAYDRFAAQSAYDRGVASIAQGDLDAASVDLGEAVRRRPDWALAWRQRGFASRDPGAQITFFTHAIKLDGNDADALAGRADAYLRSGDAARARSDLTAALARAPDTADWYGQRGMAEMLLNDDAAAAADFKHCATLDAQCAASFGTRITAIETAQNRTPRDWFAP
jgi:tetratricopeptide (TPR) repeat protein